MMKKCIFLALMSLLTVSANAQVYLSKIYNDILILGPNNVAPHCDEIAKSYVSDIENLYDVLVKEQSDLNLALTKFNAIATPTKAQSFQASEQQGDLELIEQELTILMQFKELWLKIIDQTPVRLELVDAIRAGQCAQISTNHGTYDKNEYMVTLDKDIRTIKIVEHFAVQQRDSIPQWVKKVDENCASQDPEDCWVWCYLNQAGGDVLEDFTGDVYRLAGSKIGADYGMEPNATFAQRELTMDLQGSTIDIINVVKSDTNMLFQLEGFKTVECE